MTQRSRKRACSLFSRRSRPHGARGALAAASAPEPIKHNGHVCRPDARDSGTDPGELGAVCPIGAAMARGFRNIARGIVAAGMLECCNLCQRSGGDIVALVDPVMPSDGHAPTEEGMVVSLALLIRSRASAGRNESAGRDKIARIWAPVTMLIAADPRGCARYRRQARRGALLTR
jgi:hypothetical protein